MNNITVLILSLMIVGTAVYFRIVDGVAPPWIVFPAIFAVFLIPIVISDMRIRSNNSKRSW